MIRRQNLGTACALFWLAFPVAVRVAEPALAGAKVIFQHTLRSDSELTDGRYRDLTYSAGQWYGSTFFTGPDWTRVGQDWQHPGQDTPSVRCFVADRTGRVTVGGRVFKLHQAGDGIRATIRHNDRKVWQAEIDGDDGEGVTHELTLDVRAGDRIRFVVHKRGVISCDTTGWDPCVRYADDATYQASKAFEQHRNGSEITSRFLLAPHHDPLPRYSLRGGREETNDEVISEPFHAQGAGGWRYEMEVDAATCTGLPVVYTWSPERVLQSWTVRPDRPVELNGGDSLPLVVFADGRDENGVAVAASLGGRWRLVAALDARGNVQITWYADQELDANAVVWSEPYRGGWAKGWMQLDRCLGADPRFAALKKDLTATSADSDICLALSAMVQADWRRQDAIDGSAESFAAAVRVELDKTKKLLAGLQAERGPEFLAQEARQLAAIADAPEASPGDAASEGVNWLRVRRLKRRIALANPRLDFGPLLVCQRVPPSWSHEVAQYFGWRQRPGGGLYVIERPGYSLATRNILGDQLPPGSVLEPRLSYDGRRILFAFVACSDEVPVPASLPVNEDGPADRYFHLYEINVDGSGLRQLTDGPYDDMMAEYLPDGGIVFCSTRRKGYSRCFGPEYSYRWHTYTLHRMDADGGHIRTLSYNDVSEWFPAVSNSGHILHARWDYIDRDAVTHQNLWSVRPDGTNPVAVWGNGVPKPHCTFQAKPIPDSNKIVFIAAAHHAITAGPVCVLDPAVDTNRLEAVTRVTPLPFPEAEGKLDEWYAAPWPLSEDYFLVAYSPYRLRFQGEHQTDPNPDNALGVYLLDSAGNRELLYRHPDIGTTNPTPLAARHRPPILPAADVADGTDTGTMVVTDVYHGLGDVPRGSIRQLRVVQVFPKSTWLANQPRMGVAGEENGRAILGTVPVEPDGSAYFELPAGKPVLLQALDDRGMAYQTMRSLTFVQPGEQTSCVGCHEHRMSSPPRRTQPPLASRRGPSTIDPGDLGGRPFGFVEVVQPILDRKCVACHGGEKTEADLDLTGTPHQGFTRSYWSLCGSPDAWKARAFDPAAAKEHLVPRFVQRNQIQHTPPGGAYGARGSRLMKLLLDGHEEVTLSADEIRHVAAWIDLNAIFYGVYDADSQAQQLAGRRVAMPEIQ